MMVSRRGDVGQNQHPDQIATRALVEKIDIRLEFLERHTQTTHYKDDFTGLTNHDSAPVGTNNVNERLRIWLYPRARLPGPGAACGVATTPCDPAIFTSARAAVNSSSHIMSAVPAGITTAARLSKLTVPEPGLFPRRPIAIRRIRALFGSEPFQWQNLRTG